MRNRFKELDPVNNRPAELWIEVHNVIQEAANKSISKEKKRRKAKWLSEGALQVEEERREAKSKREGKESGQFSSVAQSCLTLCDSMDCNMTGFPVHHELPEFTQPQLCAGFQRRMISFLRQVDRECPWAQSHHHACFGIYGQLPTTDVRLGNWLITNKGAIGTGSLMLSGRPNFLTRSKGNKLT